MKDLKLLAILLTLLLSMMSIDTFAYDIAVDNEDGMTIYYNYYSDGLEVTYKSTNGNSYRDDVVIPEEIVYSGKTLKVLIIGEKAFYNCSSLTSVTIPNSVTSIRNEAFRSSTALSSVTIPNSVTSIGNSAFEGCSSLIKILIGNGVKRIGYYAFASCTSLTSITIPNSVTSIGEHAFGWCTSLSSITIPNSVTSIGESAFYCCSGLTSITIPNSVTSIGNETFLGCSALATITIPNSVTSIGQRAFSGCTSLTSITIPNSVTSIGYGAFSGCSSLTSITVDVGNINYDSRDNCNAIIETKTNTLIAGCKTTTIPNSVTSIGNEAFCGCSALTTITIPNSVTSIGYEAFANCSKLEEVYCYAEKVPLTYSYAFYYYDTQNATLYVPASAINDYKNTAPWSQFGTIKAIDGGETQKCATPTISYHNGKLTFGCETEGVEYRSSITDTDIKDYTTQEIDLTVTYTIKVYATKSGYQNSDVATGTLCWIDVDPRKEGITDGVAQVKAMPVLISANNGLISVKGELDGEQVAVYTAEGKLMGSDTMNGGQATVSTSLGTGAVAVEAVKVVMK